MISKTQGARHTTKDNIMRLRGIVFLDIDWMIWGESKLQLEYFWRLISG